MRNNEKINYPFITQALCALSNLRINANVCEDNYLERLIKLTNTKKNANPSSLHHHNFFKKTTKKIVLQLHKLWRRISLVIGFIFTLPTYFQQYYHLKKKTGPNNTTLLLAILSDRLPMDSSTSNAKEYLNSLLNSLGDKNHQNALQKLLRDSKVIYLFDPCLQSQYWENRSQCWDESIYIIDNYFLLVVAFISLIKSPFLFIKFFFKFYKEVSAFVKSNSEINNFSRLTLLTLILFWESYQNLLLDIDFTNSIFLTNNSFATEILRFYLLQCMQCKRIVEVMHGVNSHFFEKYISDLFSYCNKFSYDPYSRLFFVPQIPNNAVNSIIKKQNLNEDLAINSHLNRFFSLRPSFEYLSKLSKRIMANHDNPLVIVLFGNHPRGDTLHTSATINVEIFLIRHIIKFLLLKTDKFKLIYVPHPICKNKSFDFDIFLDDNITLCKYSALCWLLADLTVSIISSTSFESVYFKAKSFMPIHKSDGFFSAKTLSAVFTPDSLTCEGLTFSLDRLLQRVLEEKRVAWQEKLRTRLLLL